MAKKKLKRITKWRNYLPRRRRRALTKPRPLRVLVVNCMSVSTGTIHAISILKRAAEHADVIIGCECDDFNAAKLLDGANTQRLWHVVHHQAANRDGVLIAIRKNRGRIKSPRWHYGSPAGNRVAQRDFLTATLVVDPGTPNRWQLTAASIHAPPPRHATAWPGYMERVAALDLDMIGGDMNAGRERIESALLRKTRQVDVITLALQHRIPVSTATRINIGGDHPALLVTLWPEGGE